MRTTQFTREMMVDALVKSDADYIFTAKDGREVLESTLRYGATAGAYDTLDSVRLLEELSARGISLSDLGSTMVGRYRLEEGTVIQGTLLNRELMRAFAPILNSMSPGHEYVGEFLDLDTTATSDEDFITPEAYELCFGIVDEINALLPEDWFFGPHPGDGADFGFWKTPL
jgi:hypothetical protein